MSRIRADQLVNRAGSGGPKFPNGVAEGFSVSGVVTATSYRGDGSQLTGIDASSLKDGGNVKVQATASGATVTGDISATNATFSGNLTVQGTTTTIDTAVTEVDSLEIDSTTSNTPLVVQASQNNRSRIVFRNNLETGTECNVELIDEDLRFVTNSGERLRIKKDGNIGIGVTDPSEKLEVNGGKIFIDGGGNRKITLDPGSNATYDSRIDASHTLVFRSYVDAGAGVKTCTFNTNGHLLPGDDNGQDLGASNARWRNIYTGDLNLSNEGSSNDVDGTWGQYTIQEGEDDLFLINRRTGKKYKFNLTEVD